MNWILQNKFLSVLIAVTLVITAVFLYVGKLGGDRYKQSLEDYQAAASQVATFERLSPYPQQDNLDGKSKSIADFETSIADLKKRFTRFQVEPLAAISPQEFGNLLIAANEKITEQLSTAEVETPNGFYCGFESYTGSLAQSKATPILSQQLGLVGTIMEDLAASAPDALVNFRRIRQPEEDGRDFQPGQGAIARAHSFEITFRGSENAAREFLTRLAKSDERYAVVRTLRITNSSTAPPKSTTAKFVTATTTSAPTTAFDAGFPNFDAFLDDEADEAEPVAADAEGAEAAEDAPEAPPAPVAPAPMASGATGERILAQVAGTEPVNVFIRFDIVQILP